MAIYLCIVCNLCGYDESKLDSKLNIIYRKIINLSVNNRLLTSGLGNYNH